MVPYPFKLAHHTSLNIHYVSLWKWFDGVNIKEIIGEEKKSKDWIKVII